MILIRFLDEGELGGQDACEDEGASGFDELREGGLILYEQVIEEVGADDIEGFLTGRVELGEVLDCEANEGLDLVDLGVFTSDADALWIIIPCFDFLITKFGSGNGQNSRSTTQVQEGFWGAPIRGLVLDEFFQAELGGRVVSGPKTESRVKRDEFLSFFQGRGIPGWFKKQLGSDLKRGEMKFPGFVPVFSGKAFDF